MTRINTNVSSLVAQKTLASSNASLQTSLTRLSTGLRINSGKDDPAGLIAAQSLGSDITATQKAISNSQQAEQMISTADSALSQVNSLLNDIRGLVTEAANSGTMSDDQTAANQLQINSSLDAINRIAQVTSFQGKRLLDGSLDFTKTDTAGMATVADLQVDSANLGATGYMDIDAVINNKATQGEVTVAIPQGVAAAPASYAGTLTANVTDSGYLDFAAHTPGADGNKIRITFVHNTTVAAGKIAATYNYDDVNDLNKITVTLNSATNNYTLAAIKTAIEGVTDNNAVQLVDVTTNLGGGAAVYNATGGAPATLALTLGTDAVNGLTGDLTFALSGKTGSQVFSFKSGTLGADIASAIELVKDATGVTAAFAAGTLTLDSTEYGKAAYVAVDTISNAGTWSPSAARNDGTDIDATVNGMQATGNGNTLSVNSSTLAMKATVDAGSNTEFKFRITGGGSLFQLGPDVVSNQQARLGIQNVQTAKLQGVDGRLYELASGGDADLATDAVKAGKIVDEVINKITSLRGRLGAFQKTTVESNIASLKDTVDNLTAAQSQIQDADFAAETANLTRAQILVQSGTAVLALSNQAPQSVLKLLQ